MTAIAYFADGRSEFETSPYFRPLHDPTFGGLFSSIGKWVKNTCRTAGRALATVAKTVRAAADLVKKIPIVGPALHGVIMIATAPLSLVSAIVSGQRIDKAVLSNFKDIVSAIREVAPMVRSIVSMIPGIGLGIGAGLAAAEALASGQSISEALIAGVKGAIPGGLIGAALFDLTRGAIAGENVIKLGMNVAIRNLPISPTIKAVLDKAFTVVYKTAQGGNIAKTALEEARGAIGGLPGIGAEVGKALDIGIAIGEGKKLQNIIVDQVTKLPIDKMGGLVKLAKASVEASPVLRAGLDLVKKADQVGYQIGLGLKQCSAVTEAVVEKVRGKLHPKDHFGFDLAVSTHTGGVVSKPPPAGMKPAAKAAFYATRGLVGGATQQKTAVMQVIAVHPVARDGAKVSLELIAEERGKDDGWLERILRYLGLS